MVPREPPPGTTTLTVTGVPQGPPGSPRDDRAALLESGWRVWKNMSQNKPREAQGSSSFLQRL